MAPDATVRVMCAGCLTSAEALVITGGGAVVAAKSALVRLNDRLSGRPRGERAAVAHDANAAFLAELGHDPEVLLGARPDVTPVPARAARPVATLVVAASR